MIYTNGPQQFFDYQFSAIYSLPEVPLPPPPPPVDPKPPKPPKKRKFKIKMQPTVEIEVETIADGKEKIIPLEWVEENVIIRTPMVIKIDKNGKVQGYTK